MEFPGLSLKLPFDVPEGWEAHLMGNMSERQRRIMEYAVETFDFKEAYFDQVKVVLCDMALDTDGLEIKSHFGVWLTFNSDCISQESRDLQDELYSLMKEFREQLMEENPDSFFGDYPEPPLVYVPDMSAFWAYVDTVKAMMDK